MQGGTSRSPAPQRRERTAARRTSAGGDPRSSVTVMEGAPGPAALLRAELLDQRPPDLLLVLDERLGLRRRHVPDRNAKVGITLLDARTIERLAKSLG